MIDLKKVKILKLAQKYHALQKRAGNVPYWYHVLSVAEIIQNAVQKTKEIELANLEPILTAAIGHDLYEDTKIERTEIKNLYGEKVDKIIWELTNEEGSAGHTKYEEKIRQSSEEAKLIKLADLIENTISVAYTIFDLGLKWTDEFYLPILENMKNNVSADKFKKYRKTAELLNLELEFSRHRLLENADKYRI